MFNEFFVGLDFQNVSFDCSYSLRMFYGYKYPCNFNIFMNSSFFIPQQKNFLNLIMKVGYDILITLTIHTIHDIVVEATSLINFKNNKLWWLKD